MRSIIRLTVASAVAALMPSATAPASAQPAAAAPVDGSAASKFVDDLSVRAFAVLKDKSLSKPVVKAKFRGMLKENFALEDIGNRLIRRYRSQITPAQYAAYMAALPDFATNAYTDQLYNYENADVQPVRTVPKGDAVDVFSRVLQPGHGQPFEAIWRVRKVGGAYKISNLTVAGINLSLTQEADFSAYIAKNGFDALVVFLKSANTKAAT